MNVQCCINVIMHIMLSILSHMKLHTANLQVTNYWIPIMA